MSKDICPRMRTRFYPVPKEALMPRSERSKYFWPASALCPDDMALLHAARESSLPRIPITVLLAQAVRRTYGQGAQFTSPVPETQPVRIAA